MPNRIYQKINIQFTQNPLNKKTKLHSRNIIATDKLSMQSSLFPSFPDLNLTIRFNSENVFPFPALFSIPIRFSVSESRNPVGLLPLIKHVQDTVLQNRCYGLLLLVTQVIATNTVTYVYIVESLGRVIYTCPSIMSWRTLRLWYHWFYWDLHLLHLLHHLVLRHYCASTVQIQRCYFQLKACKTTTTV